MMMKLHLKFHRTYKMILR